MSKLGGRFYTEEELQEAGFKSLGKNVKIHNRASIYCPEKISIGNNVRIDDFCVLIATGGIDIGNYVHIANFCYLGGTSGIEIDDFTDLAPRVSVFSASDDYSGSSLTIPTMLGEISSGMRAKVTISKYSIVGASSVILPAVIVSEGCAIGALSMLKESTDPWSLYCGIPAKKIKDRSRNNLILENILNIESIIDRNKYGSFKREGGYFSFILDNFILPGLPDVEKFLLTDNTIERKILSMINVSGDSLWEVFERVTMAGGEIHFKKVAENQFEVQIVCPKLT